MIQISKTAATTVTTGKKDFTINPAHDRHAGRRVHGLQWQ